MTDRASGPRKLKERLGSDRDAPSGPYAARTPGPARTIRQPRSRPRPALNVRDHEIRRHAFLQHQPHVGQVVALQLVAQRGAFEAIANPALGQAGLQNRFRHGEHHGHVEALAQRCPGGIVEEKIIALDEDDGGGCGDDPRPGAGDLDHPVKHRDRHVTAVAGPQPVEHDGQSVDIESVRRALAQSIAARLKNDIVEMETVHRQDVAGARRCGVEAVAKPFHESALARAGRAGDGDDEAAGVPPRRDRGDEGIRRDRLRISRGDGFEGGQGVAPLFVRDVNTAVH